MAAGNIDRNRRHPIYKQMLSVIYERDQQDREFLIYRPMGIDPDQPVPPSIRQPVKWDFVLGHLWQINQTCQDLVERGQIGRARDHLAFEVNAQDLANHIFPLKGFSDLLVPGAHPQIDSRLNQASMIPWELLEEYYYKCSRKDDDPHSERFFVPPEASRYCQICGAPMKVEGGKLSLIYHLTHIGSCTRGPMSTGRKFLIIEDPTSDLRDDSLGICIDHVQRLRQLLEDYGYTILHYSGVNATRFKVLQAMRDSELVGLYFFGHGKFESAAAAGKLILADGDLYAKEIEDIQSSTRLVFLNSCEGSAVGLDWNLECIPRSVAGAFAAGGPKVVIAPVFPILNTHAAEAALTFFEKAFSKLTLAESLLSARRQSFTRYEEGHPDIGWMAYRYFGDPDKHLPDVSSQAIQTSVFPHTYDDQSQLRLDIFGFAVDEVLLWAAKRRNDQGRSRITMTDLAAGLFCKGDLTRYVLRKFRIDPDVLCEKVGSWKEQEPEKNGAAADDKIPGTTPERPLERAEGLQPLLAKWIVNNTGDFTPQALELLSPVDLATQPEKSPGDKQQISEEHVLEKLILSSDWDRLTTLGLPRPELVQKILLRLQKEGEVDANGSISLDNLDTAAQSVIRATHALAQQTGVFPLTNRLMLAAFLTDKDGYASDRCRQGGIDPVSLRLFLLAAMGEGPPKTYGLSPEACGLIVIPVLKKSRQLAINPQHISERDLFRAFCKVANSRFKEMLKSPPHPVDLDRLAMAIDNDREDDEGDRAPLAMVIGRAKQLARRDGRLKVKRPHLFAVLLETETGTLNSILKQHGISPERLKQTILAVVPPAGASLPDNQELSLSENTQWILDWAQERARTRGCAQVEEDDIGAAFFADPDGLVNRVLQQVGPKSVPRHLAEQFGVVSES